VKYLWRIVNVVAVVTSPWAGYKALAPEKLSRTNVDPALCLSLSIVMPLFVLGALWFASGQCDSFRRPSWDRFPINWWYDPLQALFITTLGALGFAIGAQLRFHFVAPLGYWTVVLYWCIFFGLVLGEVIAYPIFRHRIETA
jgi:hypothetical protein